MHTSKNSLPKLFIGIDIHKRSWKIHTATELFDGKSFSIEPDSFQLKKYVDKHYSGYMVHTAYESGSCGYSAHRDFLSFGWDSIVVNPADISKTGKSSHQKTDKTDARQICRELKDGRLNGIEVPDVQREEFRSLFRRRNDLVMKLRKIKSQIKMKLLYFGIDIPKEYDNPNWSRLFRNWIKNITFTHITAIRTIESMLEEYEFIEEQVRKTSNELRAYSRKYYKKDYYLLKSVPGIGGIVACGILSEIGDLRRFSLKQLAGYVGLCPNMYQSGEKCRTKGMSKRSNRLIRSYLVEATWQALRFDPVMQKYYREHSGKDTKKILIKVARKLLSRLLSVIKTETPYQIGVVK
jgi:transposase